MKGLTPKQELTIINSGEYLRVIGIDEVGRGCWAGPVAVGAYIFHAQLPRFRGVADSKVVPAIKRRELYHKLSKHDHAVSYGSVEEIDSKGISKVIENLIAGFIEQFQDGNTLFLIDGQFSRNFGNHTRKIIDGDALYYSIAAASILAKVTRDAFMTELGLQFPEYGLASNKGYGTKFHQQAIAKFGVREIHRRSWSPISAKLSPQLDLNLP